MKHNPPEEIIDIIRKKFENDGAQNIETDVLKLFQTYPNSEKLWNIFGVICKSIYGLKKARDAFEKSIKLNPRYSKAHSNLGTTLDELGRQSDAITHFNLAIQLDKNNIEAYNNLGNILRIQGKIKDSVAMYEKALKINPNNTEILANIAEASKALHISDDAEFYLKKAINIDPKNASLMNSLGSFYLSVGENSKAIFYFNESIKEDPTFVHAHYNLSKLKTYKSDDANLISMIKLSENKNIKNDSLALLCFAISKAMHDLESYKLAYKYLKRGNDLKRQLTPYSTKEDQTLFKNIKNTSEKFTHSQDEFNNKGTDLVPIFIIGMPRSGTTLIEQIVSNHEEVDFAGEQDAALRYGLEIATGYKELSKENLRQFRENYFDHISQFSSGKKYITDRMPYNFLLAKLIKCAIPEAKIIHIFRDPHAVCWSNYKRNFSNEGNLLRAMYNLSDIAYFYQLYEDLINFWELRHNNKLINIDYELLVKDPEKIMRKLISDVGLKWSDSCSKFYENNRIVATASQNQVRQKIYQNSSDEWKLYQDYLGNAFDILNKPSSKN